MLHVKFLKTLVVLSGMFLKSAVILRVRFLKTLVMLSGMFLKLPVILHVMFLKATCYAMPHVTEVGCNTMWHVSEYHLLCYVA